MSVCHCQICIVWLTGAYASGVILVYGRPQVGVRTVDFPIVFLFPFLVTFLLFCDKFFLKNFSKEKIEGAKKINKKNLKEKNSRDRKKSKRQTKKLTRKLLQ